jgi:hypothetical protein
MAALGIFVGFILRGFDPWWFQAGGYAAFAALILSWTVRAANASADQNFGPRR